MKKNILLMVFLIVMFLVGYAVTPAAKEQQEVFMIGKPERNHGDWFEYQITSGSKKWRECYLFTQDTPPAVWRIEVVDPTNKFLAMERRDSELNYLSLARVNGITYSYSPVVPWFQWPLSVGKKWKSHYIVKTKSDGALIRKRVISNDVRVTVSGPIKVPAGVFGKVLKIEEYTLGARPGFSREVYFSGDLGWVVKMDIWSGKNHIIYNLAAFRKITK